MGVRRVALPEDEGFDDYAAELSLLVDRLIGLCSRGYEDADVLARAVLNGREEAGARAGVRFGIPVDVAALCFCYIMANAGMKHVSTLATILSGARRREASALLRLRSHCTAALNGQFGDRSGEAVRYFDERMSESLSGCFLLTGDDEPVVNPRAEWRTEWDALKASWEAGEIDDDEYEERQRAHLDRHP